MAILDGLKNLFGRGTSRSERVNSPLLDSLGPDDMPEGALAAVWELQDGRYPHTRRLIRESVDLRAGKLRPYMHENWDATDREALRGDGPEKYEEPRKVARRLGAKSARIKRPASGIDPKPQKDSTRIEQFANAYLDELYPDMAVVDLLLNETQTLILQIPAPCHWETIKTLYDEDESEGPHASQEEYDGLSEGRRLEYERANPSDEKKPAYKRIRSRYRLDRGGAPDDGSPDFKIDLKRSARGFKDELHDSFARRIPIVMRGPISRLDFVPINPVFTGKGVTVDGVIIRTLYRKSRLSRLYQWEDGPTELLEPVSEYDGMDGELWLYELWAYDEHDRPYVAYQVGTRATSWADDGTTAVIKLWEEYPGVTELPLAFEYGQHNAGSDADLRVLPFTKSKQQNWLQRDGAVTALATTVAISGSPSWAQRLDKDSLEAMRALGAEVPLEFRMQPNVVQPIFGELQELTSKGSSPDARLLLEVFGMLIDKAEDPSGAFGGEGPTSGLDRQVQGRDMEVAHGDVIEGARRIKEKAARHALMLASAVGRKSGRPVELYAMADAPVPGGKGVSATRHRVTLPPDLCGDTWDVIAEFPHMPGENLAGSSLLLEMLGQGAILMREWREVGWGDPHPEVFLAEKQLETYYTQNPAGQLDLLMGMAEYVRDERLKKMLELTNAGQMTAPVGGAPTAAMDDLLGGQGALPAPGGMQTPGVQLPNRAASSLAGSVGGAMSASAAAAGSPLAPQPGYPGA